MTQRLGRIVRIIVMLQSGLRCNALRIAAEAGVHRRTVFRDFAALRSLGFPIAFDLATGCYFLPRGSSPPTEEGLSALLNFFTDELPKSSLNDTGVGGSKQVGNVESDKGSTNADHHIWHDLLASEHLFPDILAELITAIDNQQRVVLVQSMGTASERQVTLRLEAVTFTNHSWQIHGIDDAGVQMQLQVETIRECLEAVSKDGRSR